jgi:hypothetical protein
LKKRKLTKIQALTQLLKDNGGQAEWKTIYQKIGKYYPDVESREGILTEIAKAGIRGVLYRDCDKGRNIFTRIGDGHFALKASK